MSDANLVCSFVVCFFFGYMSGLRPAHELNPAQPRRWFMVLSLQVACCVLVNKTSLWLMIREYEY